MSISSEASNEQNEKWKKLIFGMLVQIKKR